jgi:hypothetical protein
MCLLLEHKTTDSFVKELFCVFVVLRYILPQLFTYSVSVVFKVWLLMGVNTGLKKG